MYEISIPEELYDKLNRICEKRDISIDELLSELMIIVDRREKIGVNCFKNEKKIIEKIEEGKY